MADRSEAKTPASTEQESTSSAKPVLKLRDGTLSVTVFAKDYESNGKTREQQFVALDRSFKRGDGQWQTTNLLHVVTVAGDDICYWWADRSTVAGPGETPIAFTSGMTAEPCAGTACAYVTPPLPVRLPSRKLPE